MPSSSHITKENLDAIIKDRESIVRNYIKNEVTDIGAINYFASLVFFEPGWDYRVEPVINGPTEFHVLTYDPEA